MSEWLRVKDLPSETPEGPAPDMVFGLVLSPYDVPEAVRGIQTPSGQLRVEFRYVDGQEPGKSITLSPHIVATEGQHSGRLLALEIDRDSLGVERCGIAISTKAPAPPEAIRTGLKSALRKWTEHLPDANRDWVEGTRRAVKARESDLLHQFATQ